jgi:hypothetical protein
LIFNHCFSPFPILVRALALPRQDALLGSFRFTQRDTFVTKDVMMNCLMWIDGWDGRVPVPAVLKPGTRVGVCLFVSRMRWIFSYQMSIWIRLSGHICLGSIGICAAKRGF